MLQHSRYNPTTIKALIQFNLNVRVLDVKSWAIFGFSSGITKNMHPVVISPCMGALDIRVRQKLNLRQSRSHKIADVGLDLPLCPDMTTYEGGILIYALNYSLVLTLCTRRLCWLELFVTALKDVDIAWSLRSSLITVCKFSNSNRGVLVSISLEISPIWHKSFVSCRRCLILLDLSSW